MSRVRGALGLFVSLLVSLNALGGGRAEAAPEGQMTWAVHISLAPTWFDPAETSGIITPFMVLYALHDAALKPMPGNPMAPSLAEAWSASPDGLSYEFTLRKGVGPYRFVSFTPGVELVLEAFEQYWRKVPNVKRLVLRAIPDEATRLAALKRGEVDIAYAIRGAMAEELQRTPGLTLKPNVGQATQWVYFPEQWDPKSPWHDRRVRLAVNHAIDRPAINRAETLGFSRLTWNIVPPSFEFFWQPPGYPYDPARARQLLAEAGYPKGFDAPEFFCDAASVIAEPIVNYLNAIGIRAKLRPIERAAFFRGYAERKYRGLIQGGSGAFGNAATRIEAFVASGGTYAHGGYPDIDGLFREQAAETDRARREATLQRIQQLIHEKVMFAPMWLLAGLSGRGPRVEESGIGVIPGYAFSAPYEDVKLKAK